MHASPARRRPWHPAPIRPDHEAVASLADRGADACDAELDTSTAALREALRAFESARQRRAVAIAASHIHNASPGRIAARIGDMTRSGVHQILAIMRPDVTAELSPVAPPPAELSRLDAS